jgi:hypothetical protein
MLEAVLLYGPVMGISVVRPSAVIAAFVLLGLGGCGDDAPADGYQPVATGDTYGEWELFAEYEDGEWTGCLRLDPGNPEQCSDPDAPFVRHDEPDGVSYGAVTEGEAVVMGDGDEAELHDGRFFAVDTSLDPRLAG